MDISQPHPEPCTSSDPTTGRDPSQPSSTVGCVIPQSSGKQNGTVPNTVPVPSTSTSSDMDSAVCQPPAGTKGVEGAGVVQRRSILRGNQFRKFLKRRSMRTSEDGSDSVSLGSGDRSSLEGDEDSTYGSQEDVSAGCPSSRPNSMSFRKRWPGSSDSLSSISSKESSSEERDSSVSRSGSLLKRTYSLRSDPENNPLRENNTIRLLITFVMLVFSWVIQFLSIVWDTTRSLLFQEDEGFTSSDGTGSGSNVRPRIRKLQQAPPTVPDSPITPVITPETLTELEESRERIYYICNELMTTEEAYVDRLQLLVTAKERATKIVGPTVARQMFKDIEVIHQFHHENLLRELRERMSKWDDYRKIGDVMRKLTPFLKLYTEYVKDFQRAAALVDAWEAKSSAFAAMIRDIRDTQAPRHGKLKIQAHMMEPVQRVPRYELLLRDYLKRLPPDAPDREDAQQALESVAKAAAHFEEMMKRDSRIAKLIEIQERLDTSTNFVIPAREFLIEAKLYVFSDRLQKPAEKQVFLFSDLLLVCSRQKIQKRYKVKVTIDLREAGLVAGTSLEVPYTVGVRTKDNFIELCLSSADEELQWKQTLQNIIDTYTKTLAACETDSIEDSTDGCATVSAILHAGPLSVSQDEGRSWRKRTFTLHADGRLKIYKTSEDKAPLAWIAVYAFLFEAMVLPKKGATLALSGFGRKYLLHTEDSIQLQKWQGLLEQFQASSMTDSSMGTGCIS